ncbi:sterol regulatory element-binding protein cleavage-activating protein-like [Amphibalanus amphitrite]|uniref:sterol regulatory element-binding protein cleavage-activating protein-like n=1 Tax=Amphibalanus amphitrite TaxID=1232801 RepID=UPI001C90BB66|nr:sterol regulatory element-binding protein cleavage-activating protein-like [Amphibalanus amphitrite]XP_043190859.1 sterol regulatory element-binding protein cleavage-activating protein-like [Amphibalanus amphitrite]
MLQGLKGVFHRDKNKAGANLLKQASSSQKRRVSDVGEDSQRRVRISDVSSDRLQAEPRRNDGPSQSNGQSNQLNSSLTASSRLTMEPRPLPKRKSFSVEPPANAEQSSQSLALAMLGEGKQLQTDGMVKVATSISTPSEVMCCRFSSRGNYLAIGMVTGSTSIHHTDTAASQMVLLQDSDTLERCMPVTCSKFVPVPEGKASSVLLSTYGDGLIKFWRFQTGDCLQTLDVDEQVLALSFDCLGKYFQIAGEDGIIRVFDVATGTQAGRLSASSNHALNDGHRSRVFALAGHPLTPHELLSAGWDNTVQFWDMRHPHAVRRIYGPHICGEGLSIDPFTNHIVTASWRRRQALQIWDYGSGELITDLQPDTYESMQTCAQFMGKDFLAASGGFSNIIRVIDSRTYMTNGMVRNLPQSVRCQDVLVCEDKQFPRVVACYGSEALLMDTWH